MLILQVFQIRNKIKEARSNPGTFAGSELRDLIIGIILLPTLITLLGLGLLYALGFMHFLGGPYVFFKVVFFIALILSFIVGIIMYRLMKMLRHATKNMVNKTVENVKTVV